MRELDSLPHWVGRPTIPIDPDPADGSSRSDRGWADNVASSDGETPARSNGRLAWATVLTVWLLMLLAATAAGYLLGGPGRLQPTSAQLQSEVIADADGSSPESQ